MSKKYCITSFSVGELKKASECYGGFGASSISDFEKNFRAHENMQDSRIDVIYVFSRLLRDGGEFWGLLSGNVFITEHGAYGIDDHETFMRIPEGSTVYLFRTGDMPESFIGFFAKYAKKRWGIEVVTNFDAPENARLSSKCHALAYLDSDHFPPAVVPYVATEADFEYLARFLRETGTFSGKVIAKKSGFSSGDGVRIFQLDDSGFARELGEFLAEGRTRDYVVMQLLETEDVEYRAYWAKRNGKDPEILEVHGKERIDGHVLHNIAKGNVLRRLDPSVLPDDVRADVVSYCRNLPEPHGGLDILLGKDGKYRFTENNIMTGYLSEPEERYFAKNWLDAVADCYRNA